MTGHEFGFKESDIDEQYQLAREQLYDALSNGGYLGYAAGNGPLELTEVAVDRSEDEQFRAVLEKYGWPTAEKDGIIEPVKNYGSGKEFLAALRPVDECGPRRLATLSSYQLLSTGPVQSVVGVQPGIDTTGLMPVTHRAHALAPDFFGSLVVVLNKLRDRYSGVVGAKDDDDYLYDELLNEQNSYIVEAIYKAYQIMGRLLKVDDPQRMNEITNKELEQLGIDTSSLLASAKTTLLSADDALRNAW